MPIQGISWDDIKSKLAGGTVLIALTDRQLKLVQSLLVQLDWEATFRDGAYDFSDWDDLQQEVHDLGANANMPVYLTDLLTVLSDIKGAIDAVKMVSDGCCQETDPTNGQQYIVPIDEGSSGGVPQNLVDAGIAEDTDDWASFDDWICAVGHLIVNDLKAQLDQLAPLFDAGGAIIVGVGALATLLTVFTGGGLLLVTGILVGTAAAATLFTNLQDLGALGLPSSSDIEEHRSDLVCAWSDDELDGFQQRIDALHSQFYDIWPLAGYVLELIADEPRIQPIYQAQYGERNIAQELVDAGFDLADYSCTDCDPTPSAYLLDASFESWGAGGATPWYGTGTKTTANAHTGTYSLLPNSAKLYQEFTALDSGTCQVRVWHLHNTGIYGVRYYLDHWNGSSWDTIGSVDLGGPSYWQLQTGNPGTCTSGQLYRIGIGRGAYKYVDDIVVWVNGHGPT